MNVRFPPPFFPLSIQVLFINASIKIANEKLVRFLKGIKMIMTENLLKPS